MIAHRSALPFPFRSAGPRAAEAPASEGVSPSLPTSGAGHFTFEGDLVAVPAFDRAAGSRFSARARVAGREGDVSEALPPPQGPP